MSGDRIDWGHVLIQAAAIVCSYPDTSVTLRQLFYRLVAEQVIPNDQGAYKGLSRVTAAARRDRTFPRLIDRGRRIEENETWESPQGALDDAASIYHRDRTEGQAWSVHLGVEKAGMIDQLREWFGSSLGIPVLPLGGYAGQEFVDDVIEHVEAAKRPAVLLYAGDFDASGEDIDRDFIERTGCWHKIVRVGLTRAQVEQFNLTIGVGKAKDSRAPGFIERHGSNMQVELDALDPSDLRALYSEAIADFWDTSAYEAVLAHEKAERNQLLALARDWDAL